MIHPIAAPGQTSTEMLTALCGPDETYAAQLILIASLWQDDLTNLNKTKLRTRHFTDEKLRILAAFVNGSSSIFGLSDTATMRRLLVTHCDISERWVDVTFRTLDQLAELITGFDEVEARRFLEVGTKEKAVV